MNNAWLRRRVCDREWNRNKIVRRQPIKAYWRMNVCTLWGIDKLLRERDRAVEKIQAELKAEVKNGVFLYSAHQWRKVNEVED